MAEEPRNTFPNIAIWSDGRHWRCASPSKRGDDVSLPEDESGDVLHNDFNGSMQHQAFGKPAT